MWSEEGWVGQMTQKSKKGNKEEQERPNVQGGGETMG